MKLVIENTFQNAYHSSIHNSSHLEGKTSGKTDLRLLTWYPTSTSYWPNLTKDVHSYVNRATKVIIIIVDGLTIPILTW